MTTLTITAKGQITLRKELLRRMGVGPGDRLDVTPTPDGGFVARPVRRTGKRTIEGLIGVFKREGQRSYTIEEINEAIEEGWAGKR